jgi:hypothetical protein
MNTNICGNCENFKPNKGEKFFNCTAAKHAGVAYSIQVRADTSSCDAFATPKARLPKMPAPKPAQTPPTQARKQPTGLCPWGRLILAAVLIVFILVLAFVGYECARGKIAGPKPTPTPTTTTPNPTGPTATPMPPFIIQYFDIGADKPAQGSDRWVSIYSAYSTSEISQFGGYLFTAPPGSTFVVIGVTVYNRSNTSLLAVSIDTFYLIDRFGVAYGFQNYPYAQIIGIFPGGTIDPGHQVSGIIVYVVPQLAISGLEVQYLLDPYAIPPVVARWKLGF